MQQGSAQMNPKMNAYMRWNQALVEWAIRGVPYDTPVYLSVNEGVLSSLGLGTTQDFIRAVRQQVVGPSPTASAINLSGLATRDPESGYPRSVAFLALMVLAANDMIGSSDVDERDFFTHFCRRLGFPGDRRPRGMENGAEESLWNVWNTWLSDRGWVPTAVQGEGARKYVNYAISQALLRDADVQKLCRVFHKQGWTAARSETRLLIDLARERNLNQHLERLLDDRQRHEVLGAEILAVHQEWVDAGCPEPQRFSRAYQPPTRLVAGLYRTEDRWGNAEYYLYPKAPRHWAADSVSVEALGTLRSERAGWFYPVGEPLSAGDISTGRSWLIRNHAHLQQLQLLERDFWVLVPDPENPEASALASWGAPKLGSHFTVLFREALWSDLRRLQEEKLLQWSGDREPAFEGNTSWWEVRNCQVLAPVWDGLFLQHPELKEALQPCDRLSIAFVGGLRVPHRRGWLVGHLPQVTVYGFQLAAEVQILGNQRHGSNGDLRSTNQPFALPEMLAPGTYRVRAKSGNITQERLLEVVSWQDLALADLNQREWHDSCVFS